MWDHFILDTTYLVAGLRVILHNDECIEYIHREFCFALFTNNLCLMWLQCSYFCMSLVLLCVSINVLCDMKSERRRDELLCHLTEYSVTKSSIRTIVIIIIGISIILSLLLLLFTLLLIEHAVQTCWCQRYPVWLCWILQALHIYKLSDLSPPIV